MTKIMQKVKFKNTECQFQKDLSEDIKSIKSDNHVFVKADKSRNFYKLEAAKYNQLLHDITKTYKKAENTQLNKIDEKAKTITEKLRRLINPSKQELGKSLSFKHESKKNVTELSKHLWQLKDQKKDFAISWKIVAKAKSYSNLTKRCNLCNTEKFYVLYKPDMATLNKCNELVSTSRYKWNFLLRFNRIFKNQS